MLNIFGPKKDEVTGDCKIVHNEELQDLGSSADIIKVMLSRRRRRVEHVAHMGERRGACKVLVRKFKGKKPPRRRRLR
jgi:hypothetical protein